MTVDMTVDTVEKTPRKRAPYIVESLGEFITLLQAWHTKQIRTVEHFMNVPVGQEVEVEGEPSFHWRVNRLRFSPGTDYRPALSGNAALQTFV